jgi:predicted transcriptional regulator
MTFRELREKHGFASGSRLAKLANIDQTTISQLDVGKVADPRYSTVEAIAEVLGVTPGAVMRAIRETSEAA